MGAYRLSLFPLIRHCIFFYIHFVPADQRKREIGPVRIFFLIFYYILYRTGPGIAKLIRSLIPLLIPSVGPDHRLAHRFLAWAFINRKMIENATPRQRNQASGFTAWQEI